MKSTFEWMWIYSDNNNYWDGYPTLTNNTITDEQSIWTIIYNAFLMGLNYGLEVRHQKE